MNIEVYAYSMDTLLMPDVFENATNKYATNKI